PTQVIHMSNNSSHSQWVSDSQITRLSPDSNQTMFPKTKIDLKDLMNCHHHMTLCSGKIIGPSLEWPNPQQITEAVVCLFVVRESNYIELSCCMLWA
ncbi:hypothetical protein DSO57_1038167, partial [Entomophthora muscae]